MEPEFWHDRWRGGQIGFHQDDYNPQMLKCWPGLNIPAGATVFVPLAGKSRDMIWLAGQGYRVKGIELDQSAVAAFHAENAPVPDTIDLRSGDFFALTPEDLTDVDAVYDRAALIALPPEMRPRYAAHMMDILPAGTPMLIVTLEYEQSQKKGPPFSVTGEEVRALYGETYDIECANTQNLTENDPLQDENSLTSLIGRAWRLTARKDQKRRIYKAGWLTRL